MGKPNFVGLLLLTFGLSGCVGSSPAPGLPAGAQGAQSLRAFNNIETPAARTCPAPWKVYTAGYSSTKLMKYSAIAGGALNIGGSIYYKYKDGTKLPYPKYIATVIGCGQSNKGVGTITDFRQTGASSGPCVEGTCYASRAFAGKLAVPKVTKDFKYDEIILKPSQSTKNLGPLAVNLVIVCVDLFKCPEN